MPQLPSEMIPVAAPSITPREGELAQQAALTAWGPDHYAFNRQFEEMFAQYVGVSHAVSLPHATSALHLALAAAGVGPGDEVIVPDVTWIASVAPVNYVGAEPVFVDILPDTWCIDPEAVRAAITPRARAIIGVDLYGSMCDWPALRAIADAHNLVLIEDAAEALGSTLNGYQAGTFGDLAVFSFHGSKTMVTGEGGMLVTDDEALLARVQQLRDHGRPPGDRFFRNTEVAFKYKMSAVQAALGIAQCERLGPMIAHKREIFSWYAAELKGLKGITLNAEPPNVQNSFWMNTIVLDPALGMDKYRVQAELRARNVDSRPFFSQLSTLDAYSDQPRLRRFLPETPSGTVPATYGVNLPSGYNMTPDLVAQVAVAVREVVNLAS
ncbi:perosamine synthetase [Monaibacterium marinum]|uniref:Perosamine synthetase n=1 Tax=Pontivivens marinum TaxID=1690039 RepID=A0A2C9CYQ4_9RHOB|nr:DegT/DnrJ/EryC1/StrS family aminotransferase [Monaibacterium marinum]SOH95599.1 perosamine synthetase [Monaibacterium marinum]